MLSVDLNCRAIYWIFSVVLYAHQVGAQVINAQITLHTELSCCQAGATGVAT